MKISFLLSKIIDLQGEIENKDSPILLNCHKILQNLSKRKLPLQFIRCLQVGFIINILAIKL